MRWAEHGAWVRDIKIEKNFVKTKGRRPFGSGVTDVHMAETVQWNERVLSGTRHWVVMGSCY